MHARREGPQQGNDEIFVIPQVLDYDEIFVIPQVLNYDEGAGA
jgi:hypothetical protein